MVNKVVDNWMICVHEQREKVAKKCDIPLLSFHILFAIFPNIPSHHYLLNMSA